ncbi:MAG: 3-phosphoshikimate 1-carboxyvinyltransferase, partial [Candidatus Margulisiibacteriota bacterium]
ILSGILAAQAFDSEIYGDASIAHRPMRRIVEPLTLMGAKIEGKEVDGQLYPPLKIFGRKLKGINYKLPVASAQVKSALLLAGLLAEGNTVIEEPAPSRDHTERMLLALGVKLHREGNKIQVEGPQRFAGDIEIFVPGDISSAAFFMVAAALGLEADLQIKNVGLNPTRTGILEVLHRMGAPYEIINEELLSEEPRGDVKIQNPKSKIQNSNAQKLKAIEIGGALVPRLIDEIPIIAVLATQAQGRTVIRDAHELRVKESDRIATVCAELNKMGAQLTATADGMVIDGPTKLHGANVKSFGDHRLAMALSIAALCAEGETQIDDVECVETSFPGFFEVLKSVCK